jgi:acetylornithine deacetylase/succinyl-diaminopimelate desuccinylase-like protein
MAAMTSAAVAAVKAHVDAEWEATVVPTLCDYIKVPNQSPEFDAEWATNGLMEEAMDILVKWVRAQPLEGAAIELMQDAGKTPFLLLDVAATGPAKQATALMYGHMDKQPPLDPATWMEGLGAYTPVRRGDALYGRGGADDGYAVCAAVLALVALQRQGVPHARTVITIEASEESCDSDLDYYIEKLSPRFGDVDLVVCLDAGGLTYDRLWLTSSLRGVMTVELTVALLTEGVHSGIAGGCVADSFRVATQLLARVEDPATGRVLLPEAHCAVPPSVLAQMQALNDIPRDEFVGQFPLLPGVLPEADTNVELALNNFWRPSLTVVGAGGLPDMAHAGNVLRQHTALKLSIRIPPLVKGAALAAALKKTLESDPPRGAHVTCDVVDSCDGWAAPVLEPWLDASLRAASGEYFAQPFASVGLGGSIPFMGMLGEMFPKAQFVVTGVLGPQSNAHGPNEFINIAFAKGVNFCVARVMADHYNA